MRNKLWMVALALIVALGTTGCATKKYVRQETGAVGTRVETTTREVFDAVYAAVQSGPAEPIFLPERPGEVSLIGLGAEVGNPSQRDHRDRQRVQRAALRPRDPQARTRT